LSCVFLFGIATRHSFGSITGLQASEKKKLTQSQFHKPKVCIDEEGYKTTFLNRFLNGGFNKVLLDLGANIGITSSITTVEGEEGLDIELGALKDLDLADVDVLQREDTLASLLNTVTNDILGSRGRRGDELGNELLEIARNGFLGHDLKHLLADLTDLGRLGIGGLLDLVAATSSEGNDEKTDEVTVGGLDIDESLQKGL
jgi:hypothetical protein